MAVAPTSPFILRVGMWTVYGKTPFMTRLLSVWSGSRKARWTSWAWDHGVFRPIRGRGFGLGHNGVNPKKGPFSGATARLVVRVL